MVESDIKYIQLNRLTEFKVIELMTESSDQTDTQINTVPFPSFIPGENKKSEYEKGE